MCGIAGIMTSTGAPPDRGLLDVMVAALGHRGPDGAGVHIRDSIGLGHTRLAIMDLSTGDQPLFGPEGICLVANGEIYNNPELRRHLNQEEFSTQSDCEPPLFLYYRLGIDFAQYLRGMYAIALYDPRAKRLLLMRDPFGIKPLYYAETTIGLVFASEPRAILATGLLTRRIRPDVRDELLQTQFTSGASTIFEGIQRVLPGETIIIENGFIKDRRLLPGLPVKGTSALDLEGAIAGFETVWRDSIEKHQRSDVPYGMFLSGGIDSSAVLAMMAQMNDRPVLAYTAYFPGTSVQDERVYARRVAEVTGAEHIEVKVEQSDFWDLLPFIAASIDDPVADYAVVPTFKLASVAHRAVKVILSGEGGDELFGGYGRYRSAALRPKLLRKPMRHSGHFDRLGVLREVNPLWQDGILRARRAAHHEQRTLLQRCQAEDCVDWLPNDLLNKLDRCLMAYGIEGRVPFVDPKVAAFGFTLPDALKIHKKSGKWVLRHWLDKKLPQSEPFAPKRGFTVPVQDWMRARPGLGALVAAQPFIAEFCHGAKVEALFRSSEKRAGLAAWTLLFYALWYRHHILGQAPAGDVFETLAQKV